MLVWLSVWSEVCRLFAHGPADITAIPKPIISCLTEIQTGFTFLVPAYPGCPGKKGKGRAYSITERRVPELIPVLGSQPAGDVSHKPGGRLPLLSTRPAVTLTTLKRAATNFAAW